MGSSGVVLHVGSHMGSGFETALPQMAEAFKRALDAADAAPPGVPECPILIENAAGTGGTVGRSLDEIQALIDATGGDERIGLCIDTQHLWASGIDYSSTHGTNKLVHEIDMSPSDSRRLRCFHLNDSKIELGGNRDRHANIDEGTIGTMGLAGPRRTPGLPRPARSCSRFPEQGDGPRWEDVIAARQGRDQGRQALRRRSFRGCRSTCAGPPSCRNKAAREEEGGQEEVSEEGRRPRRRQRRSRQRRRRQRRRRQPRRRQRRRRQRRRRQRRRRQRRRRQRRRHLPRRHQ